MTGTYDAGNHQVGLSYDANGNELAHNTVGTWYTTYTVEKRVSMEDWPTWPYPTSMYAYDPAGKRIMSETDPDPEQLVDGVGPDV
jgi:YD repeat-containing protein